MIITSEGKLMFTYKVNEVKMLNPDTLFDQINRVLDRALKTYDAYFWAIDFGTVDDDFAMGKFTVRILATRE